MDVREKLIELQLQADIADNISENTTEHRGFVADFMISNGVTVQEWIPVTEMLPDLELVDAKSDDIELYACLVTAKNLRAKNGRYVKKAWYDGDRFIDEDYVEITYDVTHWMPLPSPPKGE